MEKNATKIVLLSAMIAITILSRGAESQKKVTLINIKDTIAKVPTAQTVFASAVVRPGNMTITKSGRMFVTMNPLMAPVTKVFEIKKDGKTVAYPNEKYATGDVSVIKAIIAIRADSKDNLWLLDMGEKQFIIWNTKTEKLVKTIQIPSNVIESTSFLQDFVIDEKNNRLIIADMTQGDLKSAPIPAFIVIDTKTGSASRMAKSHSSMMLDFEGGFGLNPIAIDPSFKWVYFGALHGKKVYRVPANSFDSDEKLIQDIEEYAPKSYSDGIAVDEKENVYVTNIEEQTIGLTNKKEGFKNIALLPKGQTWPDGLHIANDGFIYSTVDQLNRTAALNNGKDESTAPFLIIKTEIIK